MEPLLRLIGASDATIGYATDYLSVYLTGTLFVMFATGLNSFINAQGRPGISMIAVIIGAILNIGLDPLFIYVFGMGVTGAAIAGGKRLYNSRISCIRQSDFENKAEIS